MEQVKVYDHAGNEFLAPSQEAAEKAVESGQYFLSVRMSLWRILWAFSLSLLLWLRTAR